MTPEPFQPLLFPDEGPLFGANFMLDHAGRIMTDARIALVELVANSYDAGATDVYVSWPDKEGGLFEIRDNGTGMTEDQFKRRWRTLKYNRTMEQGSKVEFPGGPQKRDRTAFGQNGKGRHGAFCFADTYQVETWRDGHVLTAEVSLAANTSRPFNCSITTEGEKSGSGTRIEAAVARNWVPPAAIHDALGTKFLVDTGFTISLNGQKIALQDLESTQAWVVDVPGYGAIHIHQIDSATKGRTTHLKGITWWVNGKMVGEPSWEDLEENGAFLDGRSAAAKTYSFIVEADLLKDEVKEDWSGFYTTARFNDVRLAATSFITQALRNELYEIRQEKKSIALAKNVETIGGLPRYSRRMVEDFIEEVQVACPKLTEGDLIRTVGIFGKLEQCRSGYDLLVQLNACTPEEIDRWNEIMKKWDARTAEIILDELERRLRLIQQLQKLVHDRTADELHDLQPLFEKGLWIFGPEYEAIDFCSNRTMVTAIREILGLEVIVDQPRKRMDFLATSDSSLGVYSADEHGEEGEVTGYRKILILELKRGGFSLTQKELDQARDYGLQLRKAGAVPRSTPICAFVLGANVDDGLEKIEQAGITAIPLNYGVVLNKAHARTFKLLQKIREATGVEPEFDKLVPLVGEQPVLGGMFE